MRAKRGDRGAFDRIYEKYLNCLLTVAMSLLGDREQAADVVQDVFVAFIERLDGFELRGGLKAYLGTCVANRARDRLRRMGRAGRLDCPGQCVKRPGPADAAIRSEELGRVEEAFKALPAEQRMVISLKLHGGLSFRAIARDMGVALGTVQSRYRYGLDRLRRELDKR